ncbi:hypothetical protein BJ878DRAFT_108752 [Calycina marina]|uniref:DUF7730 domain-containing protein n=1 Tax=Calycina marina TaxID=1763456 RepID=A0A9P7Z1J6_9HELO|nr:hypothetical protein BJ878DRAFT_108752 [Calycina marina]
MLEVSTFESIPVEIRIVIYEHLLNDNHHKELQIRNERPDKFFKRENVSRTVYYVAERSLYRPTRRTTYHTTSNIDMHTSIMRVNRKVYGETARILYGTHTFSFDRDIEAIVPFLGDLEPETRSLVKGISLLKDGRIWNLDSDRCQWMEACDFIGNHLQLESLTLVVEGRQPVLKTPARPKLTTSDFRSLLKVQYEPLDWVWQLFAIKGLTKLHIISRIQQCHISMPYSSAMAFFIAFSASIEDAFSEFLIAELVGVIRGTRNDKLFLTPKPEV